MLIASDPSTCQMMYNQLYVIVMDKWHSQLMKVATNHFNYTLHSISDFTIFWFIALYDNLYVTYVATLTKLILICSI